ncbi:hypothetical protein SORBI_3003G271000 [Sorghum bicolor]|uniref:Uncharacterized protein n=1 Tax=Sorghum bicolor TaxID=4558 RepID=A0A1W0VZ23_SORBI|nr:hypothetical protein SORBI_3003G271000 [Sorghum bicolor]
MQICRIVTHSLIILCCRISSSAVNSCAHHLKLKSTKTGSTGGPYAVSVVQGYQYHEHTQDPDKNNMEKNARSRDFCNITLQVCVWGATFCANLSRQRVANTPRAMAGDHNECDIVKGEDQSQSKDNSKCFPQKKATAKGMMTLSAILFLALILGARHQIIKIMKSKGLDTKRSIILLSSCLCMVKSVYGALKEAKDAGELVMFYLDVSKKGD